MADKDLGEELENIEEGIENLKNKEFRLLGMKMTPMTIGALIAAIGSVVGALYGGFLMYQKVEQAIEFVDQQQEYEEKIADFENRMVLSETKLEEAIDYTRDIKQNDYDEKANRLAERNDNTIKDLQTKIERDLSDLDARISKKLQRALDNPLAN